jgi:TolA-binding protein
MARQFESVAAGDKRIMSMATEKNDLGRELSDLKREVIESRNLVIKTDNLLKNLHAELKAVGKKQEEFQKRTWISSGVAYAVFAGLCVAGAVAVSSARVSAAGADRERFESTVADLNAGLEKQRAELTAVQSAQRQAADVYRMMTQLPGDERLTGIDAFTRMDVSKLSALERTALRDRAEGLRVEIGQGAFERGKAAFRRNDMGTVITELTRFLAMNPNQADGLDASFFLGVAHNQQRQHDKAVPLLSSFVEGDKKSKSRDYAMLLLAQSYEQTGQLEKAAEVARDALATYPNTQFAPQLRGRLATVRRAMGGAGSAPLPAAAEAPAG